jgi:hypothetical protein
MGISETGAWVVKDFFFWDSSMKINLFLHAKTIQNQLVI